jgi:hypothetical protein
MIVEILEIDAFVDTVSKFVFLRVGVVYKATILA